VAAELVDEDEPSRVDAAGVRFSTATMSRLIARLGWTRKKTRTASLT
jgi:hypothetical protein